MMKGMLTHFTLMLKKTINKTKAKTFSNRHISQVENQLVYKTTIITFNQMINKVITPLCHL
jgi:hypothetical protein